MCLSLDIAEEPVHAESGEERDRKPPENHDLGGCPEPVKSREEIDQFVKGGVMTEGQHEGQDRRSALRR